jgi:hypothetical protein
MLKKTLFEHCATHLNKRLTLFEKRKLEIVTALASETKSIEGDKHETGRAMIQLEREKLGIQILETEKNLKTLLPLNNLSATIMSTLGSVIKTDRFNYYIAISAPEITIDNRIYYCISAQSPMARLILGKKVGEAISFNKQTSIITEIL